MDLRLHLFQLSFPFSDPYPGLIDFDVFCKPVSVRDPEVIPIFSFRIGYSHHNVYIWDNICCYHHIFVFIAARNERKINGQRLKTNIQIGLCKILQQNEIIKQY